MLRKLVFVGMILVLMASFTAVLADQDALDRYCNSDQYGCWVTNEEGGQDYIMFWSESARELFMGPGSNAVVADPVPAGKMSLGKAIAVQMQGRELLISKIYDHLISQGADMNGVDEYINSLSTEELIRWAGYMDIDTSDVKVSDEETLKYCYEEGYCISESELQKEFDGIKAHMEENGMEVDSCYWDDEEHYAVCRSKE